MKITKRQLRRIIRESVDQEKRMWSSIVDALPIRGDSGLNSTELVDYVNQDNPDINAEVIHVFLDELEADGEIIYDEVVDEWRLR